MRPQHVLLADDHPLVLRGLVDLIGGDPEFNVVASVANGSDALRKIQDCEPDIAVLDLVMNGLSGLDVLRAVVKSDLPTRVIFLSALITDEQILDAIAAGVHAILRKESAPETLLDCLHKVAAGQRCLPLDLIQNALGRMSDRVPDMRQRSGLTDREMQIALLVSRGLSNKLVARQLGLSEGTVKIHLHKVYRKLQVENRTALAVAALAWREEDYRGIPGDYA